jgi:hypothetical protein
MNTEHPNNHDAKCVTLRTIHSSATAPQAGIASLGRAFPWKLDLGSHNACWAGNALRWG